MQSSAPNRESIRRLAQHRHERPIVLSLYLNLDPSEFAAPPARATAVRSLIDDAERSVRDRQGLEQRDRKSLMASLERSRRFLEQDLDAEGAHAMAVFASEPDGLFETLKLPRPVASQTAVGRSPLVGPLAALERRDRWCVVLVSRREGRILRGSPDGLRQLGSVTDDTPGQHDQGGWSQARYQRAVDKEAADHLRRTAEVLFRHFKRRPFEHLLVGGPGEVAAEFEGKLHGYLSERMAGRIDVDVENTRPEQVLEAARPRIEEVEERRELEALDRLDGAGRSAGGLEEVLAALNERRVETLLIDERFSEPGASCPACGWVGHASIESCPADGAPLEQLSDVREAAVELALQQDAVVLPLRRHEEELRSRGGIGALLRY